MQSIENAKACYLAPRGFEAELRAELRRKNLQIIFEEERFFATIEPPTEIIWAENIWFEPQCAEISSISHACKILKGIQRNWALLSLREHRRAALIAEQLPKVSAKPVLFGQDMPSSPLGSWCLLSKNLLFFSASCSSFFPNGQIVFAEDKINPPNRAYLKLWEGFLRLGTKPKVGELCLDLGSSPGGWSWVLANCGARVFSVDKAPLASNVASNPLVEYCRGSAFGLEPKQLGRVDWLFSDVACYPQRLLGLIQNFLETIPDLNVFCTIKLTGQTDFDVLESFLAIPNSQIVHLCANKHEVTFVRLRPEIH